MILHDLEVFRLLPSTDDDASEEERKSSWAARGVNALLERLPKAKDMTPAREAVTTAHGEENAADVQENVYNAVYNEEEEEEKDDAALYPSSEDDPDFSGSEGSDTANRSASKRVSGKESTKRSKTKTKVAADKENERNVQPAQTRRSGRQRTRTERLSS